MPRSIGVVVSEHIAWGIVEGHSVQGAISSYPMEGSGADLLHAMPVEELVRRIADEVKALAEGEPLEAIGLAFPGIVRHRAMRLRFLDMEPEEVFELAKNAEDPRCAEFALLWHRALAAATSSSIHMSGPGKFYISGLNARFVNVGLLNRCVQEMVK